MTEYRKTNHTLPEEVREFFNNADTDLEARNRVVLGLREAGWTLQSIAEATGVTRERVRQIVRATRKKAPEANIAEAVRADYGLTIPSPPVHERSPGRVYVEPDPVKLARMLELKPMAEQVRANSTQYREEAEEYTRLIAESHLEDGVTLYRLAMRLGVTHGALRFRLARYGYKLPVTGRSKVYTRIDPKNRAVAPARLTTIPNPYTKTNR